MAAVDSPGYLEVVTASQEELESIDPGTEKFYWMLAKRVKNQIVKGEGEVEGWREIVISLVSERVWDKLLRRQGGKPYGSLACFIKEGLEMSVDQFTEGVARFAGPACLDETVRPHLPELKAQQRAMGDKGYCNNNLVQARHLLDGAARKEAVESRRIAEAPPLAVRLQASRLITKEDVERLGRLAREGKHNEAAAETLELILDRIEDMDKPSVTATSTERRLFRGKVREVIQAVLPPPESKLNSKPVRLPQDPAAMAAWLKKTLSSEKLDELRRHLCCEQEVVDKAHAAHQPKNRKAIGDLTIGSFASSAQAGALVGASLIGGANQKLVEKIKTDPSNEELRTRRGNGWVFRKRLGEEMVELGYTDRSPSWEVLQVGQL